jgi:tetratricopeptide (TPR) repeat protein
VLPAPPSFGAIDARCRVGRLNVGRTRMNLIERYQLLSDQKNWSEALVVIDEIIAASPDIDTSWFNRGVCLDELGRHNDAAESFIKAQEKNIRDFGIHYRVIRSLFLAQNYELLFEFIDYSCGIEAEILNLIIKDSFFNKITERPEFQVIKEKYQNADH